MSTGATQEATHSLRGHREVECILTASARGCCGSSDSDRRKWLGRIGKVFLVFCSHQQCAAFKALRAKDGHRSALTIGRRSALCARHEVENVLVVHSVRGERVWLLSLSVDVLEHSAVVDESLLRRRCPRHVLQAAF